MKKITKIALIACSAIVLYSCDKDDATGYSTTPATKDVSGVITVPSSTTINVAESDEGEYTYSVTLDKPQVVDIHLYVSQITGTATFGEDYEASDIVIPAYATSASGSLKIKNDCEIEDVENFTLQIGDVRTSNASIPTKTITFSIANNLSDDLDLAFDFNKSFSIAGEALTLCGIGYELDYYLLDSNLDDTGIYDAATTSCAEHLTLTSGDLADGTYHIYYDIYATGSIEYAYHDPMQIPTTISYERCGGIDPATFVQEASFVPSSTQSSGFDYVISVKIENGKFTILDSGSNVLATGRSNKLQNAIAKARLNNPNKR